MGKTFDIKPLQKRTKDANDRCWKLYTELRCHPKTTKILSIFGHHVNGSMMSVEMADELFDRGKYDRESVENRIEVLTFELEGMEKFMDDVERYMFPEEITLMEYGTKFTYIAVNENGTVKIKRKIGADEIEDEKKRVSYIISKGGAYYYEEMLKELKSKEFGKYYIVI